ncbi:hypothetical protein LIER_37043 [Lithospermum erythrorhizon]|uniref:U-box domain-containing protein n=1 Tax=Lithospermum erythrorhizon TaxID=34254 RepID=A0AAV3PEC1_LITER
MVFSFRGRRDGRKSRKNELLERSNNLELSIPSHFRCPISLDLMTDPVTLSTGMTYDRESIEKWIDAGNITCPVTNQVLQNVDQIPNHFLRKMIQDWCVQNKSHGVDRIPTPRIPISGYQVSQICSKIIVAAKQMDESKCLEMMKKIKILAKESEKNKKCIVDNGAGVALSFVFESFSSISMEKYSDLLKGVLSFLTWMFPFSEEGLSKLGSAKSLNHISWFLKGEDLSVRQNAVVVLKELISLDSNYANGLMEIDGVAETLFKIIHVPISSTVTKASLVVIYNLMDSNEVIQSFVDMGLANLAIEIIVDGDKSTCEKALCVLERICNCEKGKELASNNALTMPVLIKKLLRVSDLATEFAVSIVWKLCCRGNNAENLILEALQVGAFQKLLVILQVGCGKSTKDKVTELLKLINFYKDKVECVDSVSGFKYLKRSN